MPLLLHSGQKGTLSALRAKGTVVIGLDYGQDGNLLVTKVNNSVTLQTVVLSEALFILLDNSRLHQYLALTRTPLRAPSPPKITILEGPSLMVRPRLITPHTQFFKGQSLPIGKYKRI